MVVEISNSGDQPGVRYAGLFRRVTAWVLDGLLFFGIFGLISGKDRWKIVAETDYPDELVVLLLAVCLFYLFVDQLYLPVRFGITATRWMTGYRIQKTEGGNPGWLRAAARVGGLYILELLSLGLITFITSLFRKDRAALHDLASGTRAILPKRRWPRGPRLAAMAATCCLSALVMLNVLTHGVYNTFVSPVKNALLEHGMPSRPTEHKNPAPPTDGFSYHGIAFPRPGGMDAHVCEGAFDSYKPRGGRIDIALFRTSFKYFFPVPTVDKEDRLPVKAAAMLLRAYPLNRPAHEIAAEVAHNEQIGFPLLTPVDNTLRLYASLIYAIAAPSAVDKKGAYTSIRGEDSFALYYGWVRERAGAILLFVVREDSLEEYSLIMRGTPEDVKYAHVTIIDNIRILENLGRAPVLPPCSDISPTG